MNLRSSLCLPKKAAMTLLEVILSLALMGGTVAIVGEYARLSFQNARTARDIIQAEFLAESILGKIWGGIIEMENAFDVPIEAETIGDERNDVVDTHATVQGDTSVVLWYYSVAINPVEITGDPEVDALLIEIAVTVRQNLPEASQPVVCRLVRWLALEPMVPVEEEEEAF
jgi:hypothetical protein